MTSITSSRYHELFVAGTRDDRAGLAALIRHRPAQDFVTYERVGERWLALDPIAWVRIIGGACHAWPPLRIEPVGDAPLRTISRLLDRLAISGWAVYGYTTFELAHLVQRTGVEVPSARPLAHLVVPETEVHWSDSGVRVRSLSLERVRAVWKLLEGAAPTSPREPLSIAVEGPDRAVYTAGVADVLARIRRGELRKAIVSRALSLPGTVDMVSTYLTGLSRNTPARSFALSLDGREAAGFSPETVAEVDPAGMVSTQPLAGTRAFGTGPEVDGRLRQDLLSNAKEGFEHIISVQLARQELLGVCAPESVMVTDLMSVKERGTVQHLGSRLRGQLAPGQNAWDALAALFPAVTASGIPKTSALRVIDIVEESPRGIYAGAVIRATATGELDAALALRSAFQEDGRAWLRAGAGIVELSDPELEYLETCHKLRSVAASVVPAAARPAADALVPAS
jgi:salicylate synthetase